MGLFDNPPVASVAIGQDNQFDLLDTAGRAMIGNYAFGTPGAVLGALSSQGRNYVTFLVTYQDGSQETVRVKTGSMRHRQLASLPDEPPMREGAVTPDEGYPASPDAPAAPHGTASSQAHVSTSEQIRAFAEGNASMATICAGIYRFGSDLPAGKFDLHLTSGQGTISLYKTTEEIAACLRSGDGFKDPDPVSLNNIKDFIIMGSPQDPRSCSDYRNLDSLRYGALRLEGSLLVQITRSVPLAID